MLKNILISVLVVLFSANLALATETIDLPKAGLTPESPFYFLDTWGEQLNLVFTFKVEKKAEKMQKFAEEKLSEAKVMVEAKKTEKLEKSLQKYQDYLEKAVDKANEAKEQGKDVDEVLANVAEATQKHLIVLAGVYEKVPEQAKDAIANAMEKSSQGQENALRAISGEKKKEAEEKVEKIKTSNQEEIPIGLPAGLKKALEKGKVEKDTN